jgi:hypothetical protein
MGKAIGGSLPIAIGIALSLFFNLNWASILT